MVTQHSVSTLLDIPHGPVRAVFDTDTYNEIDDQFALVYALLSPESIRLEAIYAAPFSSVDGTHERADSPRDGMEKSFDEIHRLLEMMHLSGGSRVCKGATQYLRTSNEPVMSRAAEDLIERPMADAEAPLYVKAIATPTNVASALIKEPRIKDRIVVVWLGGHPHTWPTACEFNLHQDILASQILFDSGVPLIHVPCKNVAEHVTTTVPELEQWMRGQGGRVGDYLLDSFAAYADDHYAWSKEIWDMAPVAWLVNPAWTSSEIVPAPILTDKMQWCSDPHRPPIRVLTDVRRDPVFRDFFTKLKTYATGGIPVGFNPA